MEIDLSPSTEFLLIGLLAAALVALLTRAMIFIHREKAGVRSIYPSGWSAAQCRALESFRLLIGFALVLLWGLFLFIAPSVATKKWPPLGIYLDFQNWGTFLFIAPPALPSWPFGYYLNTSFMILLLLVSNAWVLLLVPRNWQKFGVISRSFWITIGFLVVWWGATFTATGWMFTKASATPPRLPLPGVYAARDLSPFN